MPLWHTLRHALKTFCGWLNDVVPDQDDQRKIHGQTLIELYTAPEKFFCRMGNKKANKQQKESEQKRIKKEGTGHV